MFLFVVLTIVTLTKQGQRYNTTTYWLLFVLFMCVTTLRTPNLPDYENYYEYFIGNRSFERAEPGFKFYVETLKCLITNPKNLFFAVALLSIGIKWIVIKKLSPFVYCSLLVYLSNFYILHDLIQIRAAIASGLILWSTKYIYEQDWKRFILISTLAVIFHYSALAVYPLWFINSKKGQKYTYISLILIAYVLALAGYRFGHLAMLIPFKSIQTLWLMYENHMSNGIGTEINLFNFAILLRIVFCFYILLNIEKLTHYNPIIIVWTKTYAISIISFVLFSDIPAIAFRISELFQVVEILLIPTILCLITHKQLNRLAIIVYSASYLCINIYYNQFIV